MSPYGIDKDQGGDNKSNVDYVEECVRSIMAKDKRMDKGTAIAICKKNLKNRKEKDSSTSLTYTIIDIKK